MGGYVMLQLKFSKRRIRCDVTVAVANHQSRVTEDLPSSRTTEEEARCQTLHRGVPGSF